MKCLLHSFIQGRKAKFKGNNGHFLYIGVMVRVFANGPGDLGSIQVESYQRLKKWCLMPPCLTLGIIR